MSSQQSSAPGRQYSPGPGRERREAEKTGAPLPARTERPSSAGDSRLWTASAGKCCGPHRHREALVRAPWAAFLLWADLRPGDGQGSSTRAVCQNHLEGSGNSTAQATCHTHEVQISGGKTLASVFFKKLSRWLQCAADIRTTDFRGLIWAARFSCDPSTWT